jgi:hypothetical protein
MPAAVLFSERYTLDASGGATVGGDFSACVFAKILMVRFFLKPKKPHQGGAFKMLLWAI